jgi:hypothetical protein
VEIIYKNNLSIIILYSNHYNLSNFIYPSFNKSIMMLCDFYIRYYNDKIYIMKNRLGPISKNNIDINDFKLLFNKEYREKKIKRILNYNKC